MILAAAVAPSFAQTPVASDVPVGWSYNKQRTVFHNGTNFFLVYTRGDGSIYYQADSDNVGTWERAETTLVTDQDNTTSDFEIYVVDDSRFDLIYRDQSTQLKVVTFAITGQTVSADAGSIVYSGSTNNFALVRSPADRIFAVARSGGSLRVFSADQPGDAGGVTSWTTELSNAEWSVSGEVSITPYATLDKVLVLYKINEGSWKKDGIFSRAISRGGGAGTKAEVGDIDDIGTLSNAVCVSDTDFRYVLKKRVGDGDPMIEYRWDDASWTPIATIDAETDHEYPSLFYDRPSGELYVFSIDTGLGSVQRHRKPDGAGWLTETVVDGGESVLLSMPITQMVEPAAGSARTAPRQIVWGYRAANGANFDLVVGNHPLGPGAGTAPGVAQAIPDTTFLEDTGPTVVADLNDVFSDAEDGNAMTYVVTSNSAPSLVAVSIDSDSMVLLGFGPDSSGIATISVRATDSNARSVLDTFVVTVTAVNDTPHVAVAIPDTTVGISNPPINNYRSANTVFNDVDLGDTLSFSVQSNSNPALVSVAIDAGGGIDLSFTPGQSGSSTIVIRATDTSGLFAEESFTVSTAQNQMTLSKVTVPSMIFRPGAPVQTVFSVDITNTGAGTDTLRTLSLRNLSVGPGDQIQRDGDFGTLYMVAQNGISVLPGGAPGAATAGFAAGRATFSNLAAAISPGMTLTLVVSGNASTGARDGDVLDLDLAAPSDILFNTPVTLAASWPLKSGGTFLVDGMTAAQIQVHPIPNATFASGSTRNLAFDVTLPANGYEADVLNRIDVVNLGTAMSAADITRVEFWRDGGDAVFDPAGDTLIGVFAFTGSRWQLTGLSQAIPPSGARMFVTVDLALGATEGRTIRLSFPSLPDPAMGMASANDGPLDVGVSSPAAQSISLSERVALSTVTLPPAAVQPGSRDALLLHLVATNNYSIDKSITRIVATNGTAAQGGASQTDLDGEITSVQLRLDGNNNGVLDDVATDPVAGSAIFISGKAVFTGLSWILPTGQSRHVFLTGDVALSRARDGDVLSASIDSEFDLGFADATAVVASFPLDSGAYLSIDGMVAAQIATADITPTTLAPGDGPILALDVVVPGNGYAQDVLAGLEAVNLGSATDADVADMRLWRDGGDGLFAGGGGDDLEIGPMVWTGDAWKTPVLSEFLSAAGTRLFVGITVSAAPTDSSTITLAIPMSGVTVASGNDGPLDAAVPCQQTLLISRAPLVASLAATPGVSVVGQSIAVRMTVRNVGSEDIVGVTPSILAVVGDAGIALASGPAPASLNLAPGQVDTVAWTYTATNAGTTRWTGNASGTGSVSGLVRASLDVASNAHRVFDEAGSVALFPVESMPFLINRGQTDVVPLSLTISASGNQDASDVRMLGLKLRLEDETGAGIVPAGLLGRVTISEGTSTYLSKTSLETSGDEIVLALATPVLIRSIEQATLAIRLDINPGTTVTGFRVVMEDSTWISLDDAISGAPITASLAQGSYPILSGLGRLAETPTQLDVQSTGLIAQQRAGVGQLDVPALTVQLANPGVPGLTTDIVASGLGLSVTDTNGVVVPTPSAVFSRIRATANSGILVDRILTAQDGPAFLIPLSPAAMVPASAPVTLQINVDVSPSAPLGVYRLRLSQPTDIDARETTSGVGIPVVFQQPPVSGGNILLENLADTLIVSGSAAFPANLSVGQTSVAALACVLQHPSSADAARIEMQSLELKCQDAGRNALVPATFIGRVRILDGPVEIASTTNIPANGAAITIPLNGLTLDPGQVATLDVVIDVTTTAPEAFLELVVSADGVSAVDANTRIPVYVAPGAGGGFPLTSGLTRLSPPPTRLEVSLKSKLPAALVAGVTDVALAEATLDNTAAAGSGSINVDHFVIRAADAGLSALNIGAVASRISLYSGGVPLASSAALTVDSVIAHVSFAPAIMIAAGTAITLDIRADFHPDISADAVRVGFVSSDVGVVQPGSAILQIRVEAKPGQSFPMWTETGSFSGLTLTESYSNFPNPFGSGANMTTFVYFLRSDADVRLKIWTARGDAVTTIRPSSTRAPGLYQDDFWDGRNDRGTAVVNGVYIAELVVKYRDGGEERLLRKVAVVR